MTSQDLKNAILLLAMQGKLVPQDPSDESVSVLFHQIKTGKENLVKEGRIKKEKQLPNITEDEYPFDIPENWGWIRLGDFCAVYNGDSINATIKQEKYSKPCDGWRFIATKDVGFDHVINYDNGVFIPYDEENFKIAPANSILLCMEGGSAGKKIGILDRDVCFGNKLCCFYPIKVFNKFLYFYLQSPSFISSFFSVMTGLIGGVGAAKLKNLIMPLPPLAEQERIVDKIEELMPLVEEYGKEEEQLTTLNAEFPDKLRKSILQQAIQGKLTERDPQDEPASELLKRIRAEKEKLIKEGKIKKEKPLPPITEDEIPFEIPENWVWARFYGVIDIASNLVDPKDFQNYLHIAPDNIEKGTGVLLPCKTVKEDEVASPNHLFFKGQLVYSKIRPLLRKVIIAPFDGLCSADMYPIKTEINPEYLKMVFLSDFFNNQIAGIIANRVKMPKINQNELGKTIIPIPPLAEQERIAYRVNELLSMCNELKGCYE